jgi:hypothetical protein
MLGKYQNLSKIFKRDVKIRQSETQNKEMGAKGDNTSLLP